MRQRRVEFQRYSGRRRLRIVLAALGIGGSLVVAFTVLHSSILGVRHLDISGSRHVSTAEVRKVLGVGRATPMVDINVARSARDLESLPWVSKVVIRREWPGTLKVLLVGRVAVAQVPDQGGGWAELDATGKVLDHVASPVGGLVKLVGSGTATAPGSELLGAGPELEVAAGLPSEVRSAVESVVGEAGGEVDLILPGNGVIELGLPNHLPAKMQAIATMVSQVDLVGLQTLDVEVPGAPTLTRS
ncbi:MAG: cell division protein FtsQ/DivIB [Acidimicrobiales bacterium]